MATQEMKPTPTEYKGCTFRSKSEAMFALNVDLTGNRKWIYEPKFCSIGNYTPDFFLWGIGSNSFPDGQETQHVVAELIEYKPTRPSDQYIVNLEKKYSDISKLVDKRCSPLLFAFDIYFGSVWSNDRGVLRMTEYSRGFNEEKFDWMKRNLVEVSRYRFDLKH